MSVSFKSGIRSSCCFSNSLSLKYSDGNRSYSGCSTRTPPFCHCQSNDSSAPGIQPAPGAPVPAPAEIEAHLREHVMATHVPVHWRFVDELPKTLSFKVHRPALLDLFADVAAD